MIPEVPELPKIQLAQVAAINHHRLKALPGMPHLRWESILGYSPREIQAREYAEQMRIAYEVTRMQNAVMKAKARARNRLAQKEAERR